MGNPLNTSEIMELERKAYSAAKADALLKLLEAVGAWYKAFGAAPVGPEREFAALVYERIRCATRRI